MPRPKKPGAGEPKKRSRNGCWPCKARKVKCGEERPQCSNCERQGEKCDYSIRLNWGGRTKRNLDKPGSGTSTATGSPYQSTFSFEEDVPPLFFPSTSDAPAPPNHLVRHATPQSAVSPPSSSAQSIAAPWFVGSSETQPMSITSTGGPSKQHRVFQSSAPDLRPIHSTPTFESRVQKAQQNREAFDPRPPPAPNFDSTQFSSTNISNLNSKAPLSPCMPPPSRGSSYTSPSSRQWSESVDSMYKRHKHSHSADSPAATSSEAYSPRPNPQSPYSPFATTPLTPNSSVGTEDAVVRTAPNPPSVPYPPADLRRLSVQSLLTGPPSDTSRNYGQGQHGRQYPIGDSATTTYGYDLGYPDLDTPRNDDSRAIAIFSPPSGPMGYEDDNPYGNAEMRGKDMAFEKGGYYAKPVPIKISKSLEPLPPLLLENPMNLLYFHHFLNHTARILVPHDCEKNPFREILPEMAVRDETIMNLLLAYSASHRARMLSHDEPVNRVAGWVQDVFPKLRQSLANPSQISDTTLAPAIMMASLEIISPNTFEVPITWQKHLQIARQMIIARGGPRKMDRHDRVAYFLSRWFAYLDVLGSLSGNKNDEPLGSFYWSSENASADEDFEIDCLMGFTNRLVGSLARIAELAKQCEAHRIDPDGNIREDWTPGPHIVAEADLIKRSLEQGLSGDGVVYKGCNHRSSSASESEGTWDAIEIYATNEMFHWAGLLHLYRRIYNYPSTHPAVQQSVSQIIGLLYKVRRGSTAEACLLFPMFAAGCDAREVGQREKIIERLRVVEGFGMIQVQRARALLKKVWETGRPWEGLVSGEFFG